MSVLPFGSGGRDLRGLGNRIPAIGARETSARDGAALGILWNKRGAWALTPQEPGRHIGGPPEDRLASGGPSFGPPSQNLGDRWRPGMIRPLRSENTRLTPRFGQVPSVSPCGHRAHSTVFRGVFRRFTSPGEMRAPPRHAEPGRRITPLRDSRHALSLAGLLWRVERWRLLEDFLPAAGRLRPDGFWR